MATQERKIETPVGPKVGSIFEALEILGVGSYVTQSGPQPNARQFFEETVNIEVPVGTFAIIPTPNLWSLGHGSLHPAMLDPLNDNSSASWDSEDHNWGLGWFAVSVVDVNAPDLTQNPPKQTAQIRVKMYLSDDNADDSWFGIAGYSCLFLGRSQHGSPKPADVGPTSRRMLWRGDKLR
jgi:hypothetical protein